jgi:hypothetical protein
MNWTINSCIYISQRDTNSYPNWAIVQVAAELRPNTTTEANSPPFFKGGRGDLSAESEKRTCSSKSVVITAFYRSEPILNNLRTSTKCLIFFYPAALAAGIINEVVDILT